MKASLLVTFAIISEMALGVVPFPFWEDDHLPAPANPNLGARRRCPGGIYCPCQRSSDCASVKCPNGLHPMCEGSLATCACVSAKPNLGQAPAYPTLGDRDTSCGWGIECWFVGGHCVDGQCMIGDRPVGPSKDDPNQHKVPVTMAARAQPNLGEAPAYPTLGDRDTSCGWGIECWFVGGHCVDGQCMIGDRPVGPSKDDPNQHKVPVTMAAREAHHRQHPDRSGRPNLGAAPGAPDLGRVPYTMTFGGAPDLGRVPYTMTSGGVPDLGSVPYTMTSGGSPDLGSARCPGKTLAACVEKCTSTPSRYKLCAGECKKTCPPGAPNLGTVHIPYTMTSGGAPDLGAVHIPYTMTSGGAPDLGSVPYTMTSGGAPDLGGVPYTMTSGGYPSLGHPHVHDHEHNHHDANEHNQHGAAENLQNGQVEGRNAEHHHDGSFRHPGEYCSTDNMCPRCLGNWDPKCERNSCHCVPSTFNKCHHDGQCNSPCFKDHGRPMRNRCHHGRCLCEDVHPHHG